MAFGQAAGSDLYPSKLVADGQGNLLVAGTFAGTADFGALTLSSTSGSDDVFVAKLTDQGTTGSFVWTQRLGRPSTTWPGRWPCRAATSS